MKIMVAILAILMAGILALAWQLRSEIHADRRMAQEVRHLRAKLADISRRQTLESEKECSSQAAKIFAQLGYRLDQPTKGTMAAFESHFNVGMNKCFTLLHTLDISTEMGLASSFLYDVYERREYAELDINRIGRVRHLATCELMPPHGNRRTCESEAEYQSFVARYMEATPVVWLGNL